MKFHGALFHAFRRSIDEATILKCTLECTQSHDDVLSQSVKNFKKPVIMMNRIY